MGNPVDALFGNNKPPDPPDYAGAAAQTAAGDLEVAKYQTLANRPDEYGPEGSRTWQQIPDPNNPDATRWIATTTLNPEAQKAFEAQQRMDLGLANLGEQGISQMQNIFDTPFSISGNVPSYQGAQGEMPKYGEHRQNVMDAMMARVNTDIDRARGSTNSQLTAQGIPKNSEAYRREMEGLDRRQTDAQQQAEIAAEQMAGMGYQSALAGRGMENQEGMADFTTGLDTRRQGIQEALLNRQTPINEMSAFRTGSQVNMPQFQPYGQQQFTGGPNYSQAATQQGAYDMSGYNAQTAQDNALLQGLFSLGSAGIGAF